MAEYVKQPRRKYCQFCKDDAQYIDYKDTQMLRKYVTDRGKIKPRRVTGACTQHQRDIARELDTPRRIGLTVTDSCMLAPMKSVTAVIGIAETEGSTAEGCEDCDKQNCGFRRQ